LISTSRAFRMIATEKSMKVVAVSGAARKASTATARDA
jgi:hypothetical protein